MSSWNTSGWLLGMLGSGRQGKHRGGGKKTRPICWMIRKPTAQVLKVDPSDSPHIDAWGEVCQNHCIDLRDEAVFPHCSFLPFYFYYSSCQYLIATFISFESQDICFPGWEVQCMEKTKERGIHFAPPWVTFFLLLLSPLLLIIHHHPFSYSRILSSPCSCHIVILKS